MSLLLALHKIAAERGDGLRAELLRLLENAKAEADAAKPVLKIAHRIARQMRWLPAARRSSGAGAGL
jgi:hypothetical protein